MQVQRRTAESMVLSVRLSWLCQLSCTNPLACCRVMLHLSQARRAGSTHLLAGPVQQSSCFTVPAPIP